MESQATAMEGQATSVEGQARSMEGQATSMEAKATSLECKDVADVTAARHKPQQLASYAPQLISCMPEGH